MKKLEEWSRGAKLTLVALWLVVFASGIVFLVWRFGEHPNVQGKLTVQDEGSMASVYKAVDCQGQEASDPSMLVTLESDSDSPEADVRRTVILRSSTAPFFFWEELEEPRISLYEQKIIDKTAYTTATQERELQCQTKHNSVKIHRMLGISRYRGDGFKWTGSYSAECEHEEGERAFYELSFEPCL